MLKKRVITAAAAAIGLCFLGQAAFAEVNASKSVPANANSTFTLIKHDHGGHHGHSGHMHSGGFHGGGIHGRRHFRGDGFFFGAPFVGLGGSCYWNCRQFHGPRFCRYYSADYCY